MKSFQQLSLAFAVILHACSSPEDSQQTLTIYSDASSDQIQFAVTEIAAVLESKHLLVETKDLSDIDTESSIVLLVGEDAQALADGKVSFSSDLKEEGFSLRKSENTIWVLGLDEAGTMYGGLEIAEQISIGGIEGVSDADQSPYMELRGTKYNVPLDARTPTYTEPSDAVQKNMPETWNINFWKDYIDQLARSRFNYISLWSLHPFPSMVKVPDYPDVALDDVMRSKGPFKEYYSNRATDFDGPEIMDNLEVIKEITIEQKMEFWREVMAYGKSRNVDFWVVTWNVYTNGVDGKYGITNDRDNETTRDYYRKSVKQMFIEYPDLAGIGLTTGENLDGKTIEKEDWAYETYGLGTLDAVEALPGRKLKFIHRQHETGTQDIARKFQALVENPNIEFIFSFKYAKAHVYSSTTQPYHDEYVKDIQGMKTIWTMRNDDVYHYRWGGVDFVREFIKNVPYKVSRGLYLGSDQYVWGREFMSTEPENPREIELKKHWFHWMIWGRLSYDPDVSNERFAAMLDEHFPEVSGDKLLSAWQSASMVYPITTGFHWGALDFQWYIEGCRSKPRPAQTESGFHDINRFITLPPHLTTGYISIPDYVKGVVEGTQPEGKTPLEVSQMLHDQADNALEGISTIDAGTSKELRLTLGDIQTIAYLGKYYAHKVHGATKLALYRETNKATDQQDAIDQMQQAATYWRLYASSALGRYANPLWTNRVGYVDWRKTMAHVMNDIVIAGGEPILASIPSTENGTILEAENAMVEGGQTMIDLQGYTGEGYVSLSGEGSVEWTFDAPADGTYILEFHYNVADGEYSATVAFDGQTSKDFTLWTTGANAWAWDRMPISLKAGKHKIKLSTSADLRMDNLNVLR